MSDLYDKQHDAEIVRLNDRITELEASLADSNEALQVMGLKLAHAEAANARLSGEREQLNEQLRKMGADWLATAINGEAEKLPATRIKNLVEQHGGYRKVGELLGVDHAYLHRIAHGEKDNMSDDMLLKLGLRRGTFYAAIDTHSANTVGGPTPVMDAAPASDHDKIVSWNWVLRSIENNPDHAVIISRTPVGLCFTHGNPVPELEDANELLRDALKELVELKDMKEILDANESTPLKVWSIEEEYRERKPKAWALARAVLNDTNPVMDAAPACEQLADNEDAVYAVAYKLCLQDGADEDSAHTLIWEGHPPEPWGEVWMRYEFQARELLKALDERRALMANHQATFQSSHECVSRVSNSDSQMNKQDDTRTTGESASKSDGRMKGIEMREVFEKLMLEKHLVADLSMDGDDYYDATALVGWECFQAGAAYGSNQELTDILKLLDTAPGLPLDSCKPEELQAWTTAIKSVLVHIGAALKP